MKIFFSITLLLLSRLAKGLSSNAVAIDNTDKRETPSLRAGSRRMDEECDNIMDIICQLQNTKTFCSEVQKAVQENIDFAVRLGMRRPYTVFAPTDDAFAQTAERFAQLKPDEKNRTIFFHFNEDVVMTTEDLECSSKLTSLTNDTSRTKCRRKSPGVYDKYQRGRGNKEIDEWALIDTKSKESCSGIVHRVDKVLLPILFKPYYDLVPPIATDDSIDPASADAEFPTLSPTLVDTRIPEPDDPVTPEPTVSPTFSPTEFPSPNPTLAITENPMDTPESSPKPTLFMTEEPTITNVIPISRPTEAPSDKKQSSDTPSPTVKVSDSNIATTPTEGDVSTPKPTSNSTSTPSTEETEPEKKRFRINALGINLIMFSTLLLCFVFVCMRR